MNIYFHYQFILTYLRFLARQQQFPCRSLHKAPLRKTGAILMEQQLSLLHRSIPAASSHPFTFSPFTTLKCRFIRS